MVEQLRRFEAVEWHYDGLNGKIIPWTLENGGTSHDPSILAFVLDATGKVVSMCPGSDAYRAPAFAEWLGKQALAYERAHPRTRVPFLREEVTATGEGADRRASCAAMDAAVKEKRPVAVYVGREARDGDDRDARKEAEAARRFEKETLQSKDAAEDAGGWTLVRLDRGDRDHALLAATWGVKAAPCVVLLVPGEEKPELLEGALRGSKLADRFKDGAAKASRVREEAAGTKDE